MPEVPLLAPTPWPVVVYDVDPSQPIDEPLYFRGPWYRTLFRDIKIVLRNAPEIPYTLIPLPTLGAAADPNNPKDITTWGFIFEVVATIVSLVITVAFIPAFLVGMVLALVILFVFLRFNVRLQGADIRLSDPADGDKPFANEAWLFVNGIATTGSGVQLTVDFLRGLFGRQVMGICNRSQGVWFDLIECVLQRDLLWPTSDVNHGYGRLCDAIRNERLERVVLIAHSQGGIIAAAWMSSTLLQDQLLADFPSGELAKLEIYTFASAAIHCSAPSEGSLSSPFGRIEHFANSRDFVADIGVLAYAPDETRAVLPPGGDVPVARGRFAGRIFKRIGHTGHLLLTHYLKPGDSFLQHPAVVGKSKLVTYLDGGNPIQ